MSREDMEVAWDMPLVQLSSGLWVGHFSGGIAIRFDDGTVLPACSRARTQRLMLGENQETTPNPGGWTDVRLSYWPTLAVVEELKAARDLWQKGRLHILVVPYYLLAAMQEAHADRGHWEEELKFCRTVKPQGRRGVSHRRFYL